MYVSTYPTKRSGFFLVGYGAQVGLAVDGIAIVVVIIFLYIYRKKKKKRQSQHDNTIYLTITQLSYIHICENNKLSINVNKL